MTDKRPRDERISASGSLPASFRKRRRPVVLPLTPLIDVTFLLLLYFLLTSTFYEPEQQLAAALPRPGGEMSVLLPVHVTLAPTGAANEGVSYRVGEGEPTAELSSVRAALAAHAKVAADPELPVIIHTGRDVRWKYVIEIFNTASAAGFQAVTFAPAEEW